eukprot:SAG31_NODE_4173_length_3509_cov_58.704985_2_plen_72_part_00
MKFCDACILKFYNSKILDFDRYHSVPVLLSAGTVLTVFSGLAIAVQHAPLVMHSTIYTLRGRASGAQPRRI